MAPATSDLPKLSAPAVRALTGAGITRLAQIAKKRESEIAELHGIGPNALKSLKDAMAARGLSFKR